MGELCWLQELSKEKRSWCMCF
ncbi:hypothetical protein CFP56_036829 [Quercus suber]|uniref:Uncharacterized protein n=1 Tax=Quercus suber TaxID=58331 RepID=A0AAW0LQG8_QUESU